MPKFNFPTTWKVAKAIADMLPFRPMTEQDYSIFGNAEPSSEIAYGDFTVIKSPTSITFIEGDEAGNVIQEVKVTAN